MIALRRGGFPAVLGVLVFEVFAFIVEFLLQEDRYFACKKNLSDCSLGRSRQRNAFASR